MINGNSWNANIPSTLHTMIENDHKNRLYKISRQNPFHGSCRLIYVYGNPLSPRKANHPSRLSRQNLPVQREQHSWEETEHPVQQVPGHPHALLSTHGYCWTNDHSTRGHPHQKHIQLFTCLNIKLRYLICSKYVKTHFLGYWSCVSITYSCTFHSFPVFETPPLGSRTAITFPANSILRYLNSPRKYTFPCE